MKAKKYWVLMAMTVATLALFLGGCGPVAGVAAAVNRENLNKLEVGMTKSEVKSIMGKPHQREADMEYEWWFYLTNPTDVIYGVFNGDENFTPIAFKDEKLIGWGRNFYIDKTRRYDVKIDQTIKQD